MYWKLFVTFTKVGAFTIGGGYAMLPLIERYVVDTHKWLDRDTYVDMVAVAQSAPGALAINMATFVGYALRGVWGSVVAVLGTIIAPFAAILALALLFKEFSHVPVVERFFKGVRPVVVALIAYPVVTTLRTVGITWVTVLIAAASAALIYLWGVSPLVIVLLSGLGGYIWHRMGPRPGAGQLPGASKSKKQSPL